MAALLAGVAIVLILAGLFAIASRITAILGLPPHVHLPLPVGVIGLAISAAGVVLATWLFKYRKPSAMIVSTYFTFTKMLRLTPVAKAGGRAEPLVVQGPQRYVRHPLYLAALAMVLGWSLANGMPSWFVWSVLMYLWFRLVQIPFEERELVALFGEQYLGYCHTVPMLVPFTKPTRPRRGEHRPPSRRPPEH